MYSVWKLPSACGIYRSASSYPGAQFYMECAQINITGGGRTSPGNTVSFPGAYSGSDPGINIYTGLTSYTIPGPTVWSCDGTNPGQSPEDPTTATTPTQPPPTDPPVGTIPQWAQCGGIGWTGGTVYVSPFTCTKVNDWVSSAHLRILTGRKLC